jgi:hypothetical protein
MKIHPAGDYERGFSEGRRNAGQSKCVRVVSVEDSWSMAELLEDGPDHPGVDPDIPRCRVYPDSTGLEPACQLALAARDYYLLYA